LINKNRAFFCSELVAKAFKILGIIENDNTPCNRFFPHHFSTGYDKSIKFTKGTTIENECQIIMENEDLLMQSKISGNSGDSDTE